MTRPRWLALCVLLIACDGTPSGTDAGPRIDARVDVDATDDDAGPGRDAGMSECGAPSSLDPVTEVTLARVADLDADDRLELIVASPAGGLYTFDLDGCRASLRGMTLESEVLTGLDVGDLDGAGGDDIVVLTDARTLIALSGADLGELWREAALPLSSGGAVLAAHLDTDGDHDVAAFDASNLNLLRVENTGTAWNPRVTVGLPAGIARAVAGDLGGDERDELLFLGGGLVEVVSVADFDFSDVRPRSSSPHGAAAFGDFDGDANGDAMVSSGSRVELWRGDGTTNITMGASVDLGAAITDLATLPVAARPGVAVLVGGEVQIVSSTGGVDLATRASGTPIGAATGIRIFGGDATGDRRSQPIVVTSDGFVHVLP